MPYWREWCIKGWCWCWGWSVLVGQDSVQGLRRGLVRVLSEVEAAFTRVGRWLLPRKWLSLPRKWWSFSLSFDHCHSCRRWLLWLAWSLSLSLVMVSSRMVIGDSSLDHQSL
ncbi:unnamed protein product [Cuscuta europaea]|uniref:Uncharacterized protein n=1 Tax=Cuscuta europaea TaxID=41803 RepID=A0A9P0ZDS8_CUSEU|nr:unnamed protein product [Cuscuta europaea]